MADALGRIAQPVRALPSHGRGRGFEFLYAHCLALPAPQNNRSAGGQRRQLESR